MSNVHVSINILFPLGSEDSDVGDDSFSSDGGEESDASNHESDASNHESDDPNKGWADAMAKILKKKIPSDKASTILVKSKALVKEKEIDKKEKLEKKEKVRSIRELAAGRAASSEGRGQIQKP